MLQLVTGPKSELPQAEDILFEQRSWLINKVLLADVACKHGWRILRLMCFGRLAYGGEILQTPSKIYCTVPVLVPVGYATVAYLARRITHPLATSGREALTVGSNGRNLLVPVHCLSVPGSIRQEVLSPFTVEVRT